MQISSNEVAQLDIPADLVMARVDAILPLAEEADARRLCQVRTELETASHVGDERAIARLTSSLVIACQEILDTRAAMTRTRAEISAARIGPEDPPMDVTAVFNHILTHSAPRVEDQVVVDIGLPEIAGPVGHVQGRFLHLQIEERPIYGNAAPEDTVFLPEGHMITLRPGEAIVLRNAGFRCNGSELGLGDFSPDKDAVVIEAVLETHLIGPLTLGAFTSFRLDRLGVLVKIVDEDLAQQKKSKKFWHRIKVELGYIGTLFVGLDEMKGASEEKREFSEICEMAFRTPEGPDSKRNAYDLLKKTRSVLDPIESIQAFPARKVVVRGNRVKILRPQPLLVSVPSCRSETD